MVNQDMTLFTPTFKNVHCKDCDHIAPEGILMSFNTDTGIPDEYSFDGECPKCGSENTIVVDPLDRYQS